MRSRRVPEAGAGGFIGQNCGAGEGDAGGLSARLVAVGVVAASVEVAAEVRAGVVVVFGGCGGEFGFEGVRRVGGDLEGLLLAAGAGAREAVGAGSEATDVE